MTFLDLEKFITVADTKSITGAARELYVSPQALSKQIKNLEEELGTKLFNRKPRITLTHSGEILYNAACTMLALKDKVCMQITEIERKRSNVICIGVSSERGKAVLTKAIKHYKDDHEDVSIIVKEGSHRELSELAARAEVDFIIGLRPSSTDGMKVVPIMKDDTILLIPRKLIPAENKDFELLTNKFDERSKYAWLEDCPILTTNNHQFVTQRSAEKFLESIRIRPKQEIKADSVGTLFTFCLQGMGVLFYSKMLLEYKMFQLGRSKINSKLLCCSLQHLVPPSEITICYQEDKVLLDYEMDFINIARTLIN